MADERFEDAVTPSAIDRELQRALAVDPSPEFVARVRMRVASEPPPRRGWTPWAMWTSVAAAALFAVALAIAVAVPRQQTAPTPSARGTDVRLTPDVAAMSAASGLGPTSVRTPSVVRQRRQATGPVAEPDVLVSADEAAALRDLFTRGAAGRLELSLASVASAGETDLLPPEIVIPLIKIEPLVPPVNVEEGERQ
jgi:hypothetical protein